MRSWAKFIFAAAIAGALWVSELGSWTTGAASTEAVAEIAALELSPMEVHEVRVETLRSMVPFVGTLRPVNRATLRAEVAARVSEVLVEEGQRVAKGDVVARLDTEDLAAKVKEREANLESAACSTGWWALIPPDDGRAFHAIIGSISTASWATIPRDRGHFWPTV